GDHLPGVHSRLDDLQRDATADRLGLLGDEDDTHSPFANLLQELVGADRRAGLLAWGLVDGGGRSCRRLTHEAVELAVGDEETLDLPPEGVVALTRSVEKRRPLAGWIPLHCVEEYVAGAVGGTADGNHQSTPCRIAPAG